MPITFGGCFPGLDLRAPEAQPRNLSQMLAHWEHWAERGSLEEMREVALERLKECVTTQGKTLDLSALNLRSLPRYLPDQITALIANGNQLKALPDHLPCGLSELEVSDNAGLRLTALPEGLVKLFAVRNGMETLPRLPHTLEVCSVWSNHLGDLPPLPDRLRILKASKNALRCLPPLPPALAICNVSDNRLKTLPHLPRYLLELHVAHNSVSELGPLPDTLERCDVEANRLKRLPAPLPSSLVSLCASTNKLSELPVLPPRLQTLRAAENRLRQLPSLPDTLQRLDVRENSLERLTSIPPGLRRLDVRANNLVTLPQCVVDILLEAERVNLHDNPWELEMLVPLMRLRGLWQPNAPEVPFINAGHEVATSPRALCDAVTAWYPEVERDAVGRAWNGQSDEDVSVQAFSAFLDRLQKVKHARKNPAFRQTVAHWLSTLVRDQELRASAFREAYDATQSCEDRVALTWCRMQTHALQHAVVKAGPDTPPAKLVAWAKEVCALSQLENIARDKVMTLQLQGEPVDEIEVHLGYLTGLAKSLNLRTQMHKMRFGDMSHISKTDLKAAYDTVNSHLEGPKFAVWLNNWSPWQSFLARRFPAQYERADEQRGELFSDASAFEKMSAEIRLVTGASEAESALIAAEYETHKCFEPLTRQALSSWREHGVLQKPLSIPRPSIKPAKAHG